MNSKTYWRNREEQWIEEQIKNDLKLANKIDKEMLGVYREIEKDIFDFYTRYAAKEGISLAEARKRASDFDVQSFASKAKKYVQTKNFSPRANSELRLYNLTMKVSRLELLKLKINFHATLGAENVLNMTVSDAINRIAEELQRNAGILKESTDFDVYDRAKQVLNGSYHATETNQLRVFSDKIWGYKATLVNDIDKLLLSSMIKGENPRVMARRIRDKTNVMGYEAERLARTEMSRIYSAIQDQSFKDNEIDEYEYIAEPTACDVCAPLNGKIFKVSDAVVGLNSQPMHPNCKCSKAPRVDQYAMYRSWLDRGIIDQAEYRNLEEFRKDYDNKFEVLMEKRNRYELSMQEKRKKRRLR
ncbi:minor capsid protein [Ignavigranum ruoffiae]|uniref:minor capsid protein n=1 Tax=Ignavigranum ruoffiae TaxID=89093 RepID=UPI002354B27C|nr:minor capsid protein [Ignavigranum ruoffiae]